jgi:hypothetical protein
MSRTSKPPADSAETPRLERTARRGHNGRAACKGDKPDHRIVALVRLIARLAAEDDFRNEPDER